MQLDRVGFIIDFMDYRSLVLTAKIDYGFDTDGQI